MKLARRKVAGVVSIEFALGFMAFWTLIAGWIEASYISYISSLGDYAITEASRQAKTQGSDYITAFDQVIQQNNAIWSGLVDSSNFKVQIRYLVTPLELSLLTDTVCVADPVQAQTECGTSTLSSLAIYHITYDYNGIFTFLSGDNTVFDREVITIQEYQRSAFPIQGS